MVKDNLYITWFLMLIVGLLVSNLFFHMYKNNKEILKSADKINSTIVEKKVSNKKVIPIYIYDVKFEVSKQSYHGQIKSIFKYDDILPVFYDKKNPSWIMEFKGNSRHLYIFLISLLFPLYPLFHIIINIFRKREENVS